MDGQQHWGMEAEGCSPQAQAAANLALHKLPGEGRNALGNMQLSEQSSRSQEAMHFWQKSRIKGQLHEIWPSVSARVLALEAFLGKTSTLPGMLVLPIGTLILKQ